MKKSVAVNRKDVISFHMCVVGRIFWAGPWGLFMNELIGSLSNHDGNAKENLTLKMTSNFNEFQLLRDSFNSFTLSNVAEQSGSWLCKDGVTVQVGKRKFTVVCSRST